jgi:NADH-quinone oxidoreductase subunit C
MTPILDNVIVDLRAQFGDAVRAVTDFRDDVIVTLDKAVIVDAARALRDHSACPFPLCEDVFGIDQDRRRDRFEVNYRFFSVREKVRIQLKVAIDEADPVVDSIVPVFPSADWNEREAYDMYGIVFRHHPDLRRMYMPEDFAHYPLRKDFPMLGIPGSLSLPTH